MINDTTFITNEKGQTLLDRFKSLIKDTTFFDVLVGYFYISGFYSLVDSLEKTEKIRILIGIGTDKKILECFYKANESEIDSSKTLSPKDIKTLTKESLKEEMECSDDKFQVEWGINKLIEWLKNGKIEIKAYPSKKLHAKLYIMTFKEEDRDVGRVITGSSNFTLAGLTDNLEFNVELKNRSDYEFALTKFNQLWNEAIDISENFVDTLTNETWINDNISPYEIYLKFLYEYFKNELNQLEQLDETFNLPENFKKLEYQIEAVLNAKRILDSYGGVFLSDVVGLGKTYMAAMLAKQLNGRTLVIAPPSLLKWSNPGSWPNVFAEFNIPADYKSLGSLEKILKNGVKNYKNIIIDEAHRFRSDDTQRYDYLSRICRGKRVILVTATPYNNRPKDILNLIKLFQNPKQSNIPNLPNLEGFFNHLERKLKKISKKKNYNEYIFTIKQNAKEIREKVLKYLMVRRTRTEIQKYFAEDLKKQGISFPELQDPIPLFYQLNNEEETIFNKTVEIIAQKMSYARYTPLLYHKDKISALEKASQTNMGKFMKILLIKRLESSFYAFRKSLDRFIESYQKFINQVENGKVVVSKKHFTQAIDFLEKDNITEITRMIEEDKVQILESKDFNSSFLPNLKKDLEYLIFIKEMWGKITRDPKIETFKKLLNENKILKENKLIIFTESSETADYLEKELGDKVLKFTGQSGESIREQVIENFDARAKDKKDNYRILVATEVLSEGVNLHRSNVVINYDIPWNPTRMMQRIGRINRLDTKFKKLYVFNFFPSEQGENEIHLKKTAESKINAFFTMLGGDASILTEGEPIGSHELFNRLLSKKTLIDEDEEEETELKYLKYIQKIRKEKPELFQKIKQLPKKCRSTKIHSELKGNLLSYFRKGELSKFFITDGNGEARELDFLNAAKIFESKIEEPKQKLTEKLLEKYYELLTKNKLAFEEATKEEAYDTALRGNTLKLKKIIEHFIDNGHSLTDEQEEYLGKLIDRLRKGAISKRTIHETLKKLERIEPNSPEYILTSVSLLQHLIPQEFLEQHISEEKISKEKHKREVILSLYLT